MGRINFNFLNPCSCCTFENFRICLVSIRYVCRCLASDCGEFSKEADNKRGSSYRRMLKAKPPDKIINEEIFKKAGTKRRLWRSITDKTRDQLFLENVIRHNRLLRDILEVELRKKGGVGRPLLDYTWQIIKDICCTKYS